MRGCHRTRERQFKYVYGRPTFYVTAMQHIKCIYIYIYKSIHKTEKVKKNSTVSANTQFFI